MGGIHAGFWSVLVGEQEEEMWLAGERDARTTLRAAGRGCPSPPNPMPPGRSSFPLTRSRPGPHPPSYFVSPSLLYG